MQSSKLAIKQFQQLLANKFVRNVGWLGVAELVNRVFRLGTTVTLARVFSPQDYGLMAILYTTFEFANVFCLGHGIAAKIVQAEEKQVKTLCDTAYWLSWLVCGSIAIFQCLAAFPIAQFYDNQQLILPLCSLALIYLMFPTFAVHSALIERENRLKVTSLCLALQSFIGNIITVILALLGMGIWSIVWAMVLSTPVWTIVTWRKHSWRPPRHFQLYRWQEIFHFGKNVVGVELLSKLRNNLDYLIVGKFLGVDALGIYFFAFNAGSGITMNVVNSFISALFPHLCSARNNYQKLRQNYLGSLKIIALVLVPLILLQSSLAPMYVPIIFGQKWVSAVPILIMVCLSVLPQIFARASFLLLNAIDKTHITLYLDLIFTVIFTALLLVAVQWGIFWVAAAVLIANWLILTAFSVGASHYALKRQT